MKHFSQLAALLLVLSISIGCSKNDPPNPDPPNPNPDAQANEWIYEVMAAEYLYNAKAKAMTSPNYEQTCENFFTSLLSTDPNDNDGKHPAGGDSYFYSYMERLNGGKALETGSSTTYGFEYILYPFTTQSGSLYLARVLYVAHNSVAKSAGIERGMWIQKVGGTDLPLTNYKELSSGNGTELTLCRLYLDAGSLAIQGSTGTITLPAATTIDNSPVYLDTVYTRAGGRNVAYLVYNSFDDGDSKQYDTEMKNAFRRFKTKGATHLIVDLRYNPGGLVESCRLLASMVSPRQSGDRFANYTYNAELTAKNKYQKSEDFMSETQVGSDCVLNMSRVYVLTSDWTASASELFINALRPYLGSSSVIQIGITTEGKNVGSINYKSTAYSLSLQPIITQISNKDGFSDYKNGFTPNPGFEFDELEIDTDELLSMQPLGEDTEYLLKRTLEHIETGSISSLWSRSSGTFPALRPTKISSINDRPLRGAIIKTIDIDND